ncbi:hypothetical protein [Methanocaldococcus sp.]
MKCPYCGGEECINKDIVEIYLKMVEQFFNTKIGEADKELEDFNCRKYPAAGDVGECKKTHGRIYLCPYCKKPFKAIFEMGKITIKCPNCSKTLCLPATNRTIC